MKLILIFLMSLSLFSCHNTKQNETMQAKMDSLERVNDSLTHVLATKQPETSNRNIAEADRHTLLKNGITNPEKYIEETLQEHVELIPLKAVLGGTMHFGVIQVLGSQWVLAEFDDGHIQGRAIYQFKINKQGNINFKLLSTDSVE